MGRRTGLYRGLIGLLLSSFCVVGLGLTGCQLRTDAARVPQLVLSSLSDPKTFNAVLRQEVNPIFNLMSEGLVVENGETGEIKPALAESWTTSDDDKTITYTLRQGLKWSDGEPLTVDDVVFTFNQVYLNEAIPTDTRDVLRIGESGALPKVRKLDERRVEFSIPEPFAPFLRVTGIGLLPQHVLQSAIDTQDAQGRPKFLSTWGVDTNPLSQIVVAGPYRPESFRVGERVVLRRNPYYWRTDAQGQSQPYIDRIVLQTVESTDTDLLQFRSGGLDITTVSPDYYALLKKEEQKLGFKIYNGGPSLSTLFISFNLNTGRNPEGKPFVDPIKSQWFNEVKFRQAIAYGINRQQMLNNIFQGLGEPQHSMIAVQSPYYYAPAAGLTTYPYDPEKAKVLLLAGGFQYNAAGQLLDKAGNRVRFSLITNAGNKIRESMGAQIKQDLSKLGIQVDFNPMAFNTLVERLTTSKQWDCYLLGFGGGGVEPNSSFNIWAVDGGLHTFNQGPVNENDPPIPGRKVDDWEQQINDLYIKGAQELDEAKRKAIYAEAQELAQEYLPFIHMITPLSFSAVRDTVENVRYSALGGALWNIHELEIAADGQPMARLVD